MLSRVLAFGLVFLVGGPAYAQIDGAVQLGLSTDVVSLSTLSYEGETPAVAGLSIDSDGDIETTELGFGGDSGVVLHGGYGITEQFIVGASLQIGSTTTETSASIGGATADDVEEQTTAVAVGPTFEFSILEEGAFRPYLLASAGYASLSQETEASTLDFGGVQVLGAVGVHCFLAEGFSLDPALHVSYASLSGELDPDTGNTTDLEGTVTSFGLSVGFSGWVR
jgi:hypothetical protein